MAAWPRWFVFRESVKQVEKPLPMPRYQLICLNSSLQRVSLILEGHDEPHVHKMAEKKHLQMISCVLIEGGSLHAQRKRAPLTINQLASFCGRLAPLLEMNIPTRQALGFLSENSPDPVVRDTALELKSKMESRSLSDALKGTKRFPPMVEGIVQVGSDSSDLAESLHTLARFYQMLTSMQTGIKNALIQPSIAFVILISFLFFSIFFTIPQIAKLLDGLGTKPGWIISMTFSISHLMVVAWPLVLLLLGVFLYLIFFPNPVRTAGVEYLIKHWGAIRSVFHNMRQTAILYALAIMVKAQIPQGHIFRYLVEICRNTPIEFQMKKAMEFHARDGHFAKALEKYVDLDPEIIFTLRVGEETSSLHLQAEKMAIIYEKLSLQASEALGVKLAPILVITTALLAALLFCLTFGSVISVCLKLIRNGA